MKEIFHLFVSFITSRFHISGWLLLLADRANVQLRLNPRAKSSAIRQSVWTAVDNVSGVHETQPKSARHRTGKTSAKNQTLVQNSSTTVLPTQLFHRNVCETSIY